MQDRVAPQVAAGPGVDAVAVRGADGAVIGVDDEGDVDDRAGSVWWRPARGGTARPRPGLAAPTGAGSRSSGQVSWSALYRRNRASVAASKAVRRSSGRLRRPAGPGSRRVSPTRSAWSRLRARSSAGSWPPSWSTSSTSSATSRYQAPNGELSALWTRSSCTPAMCVGHPRVGRVGQHPGVLERDPPSPNARSTPSNSLRSLLATRTRAAATRRGEMPLPGQPRDRGLTQIDVTAVPGFELGQAMPLHRIDRRPSPLQQQHRRPQLVVRAQRHVLDRRLAAPIHQIPSSPDPVSPNM